MNDILLEFKKIQIEYTFDSNRNLLFTHHNRYTFTNTT